MAICNPAHAAQIQQRLLAVAAARAGGDSLRIAQTVRHLADAYRAAGRWPESDAAYVEALAMYRAHRAPPALDLANAIRGFALLKDDVSAPGEARRLWQEARDLYASLGIAARVAECDARLRPQRTMS